MGSTWRRMVSASLNGDNAVSDTDGTPSFTLRASNAHRIHGCHNNVSD